MIKPIEKASWVTYRRLLPLGKPGQRPLGHGRGCGFGK